MTATTTGPAHVGWRSWSGVTLVFCACHERPVAATCTRPAVGYSGWCAWKR